MECYNWKGQQGVTRDSWEVFQSYLNSIFIRPSGNWQGKACGRTKQNRPGQKKCKGDRRVKGSEDSERDRPQESGCWSSVRVQEMGWSQREKDKQLLYPAQPQRWGQRDPDSFPRLYLGAYSAQTQCVADRGLLLLFCSLLCLLCLIFALSLVLALFHFPAELFQCVWIFLAPCVIGRQSHPWAGMARHWVFSMRGTLHISRPPVRPWRMHFSPGSASWS